MPTLPKCLRRPHPWLAGLLLSAIWAIYDLQKKPEDQKLSVAYRGLVFCYQFLKPKLGMKASCRFRPKCSEYSRQAVQEFGLVQGFKLTIQRIHRCDTTVPRGTHDPIPSKHPTPP